MSNIHERYQAGINALNDALKKYHPDKGGDPVMTRRLIATKKKWTELYNRVKDQPVARLQAVNRALDEVE